MPSNPITPEEQYDILINRSLTPRDGVTTETYMAAGYITMPPATVDGPVKWRLFDAAYIKTGIVDPNRLGTGSTGAGNLYLADDGTWKVVSTSAGGLPPGGTDGQILAKIDSVDFNTEWIDNYTSQVKHEVKLGATLSKGTPVYVSGSTGGSGTNMIVSAASNATEATSSKTMGLLESGGVTNDFVFVVTEGLIAGVNTGTATAGDPVWLGPSGTLLFGLASKPVAPVHMVFIGIVTRVHAVNGEIFVKVQNGFELEELHNVAISSLANNDLLVYESATSLWKNKTISAIFGGTPLVTVPTLAQVTTAGNTTSNSIIYSGATEAIRPSVDSTGALGASNYRWLNVYTRGVNSGANSLDILGTNINLNDNSGNIKLRVFGSTGNVVIQNGGTFTDAGYKLDVIGNGRFYGATEDAAGTATLRVMTANTDLGFGGNTTYSWMQSFSSKPLYINQLGNNVILNLGAGSVGIGTASPSAKLHVADTMQLGTTSNASFSFRLTRTSGAVPQDAHFYAPTNNSPAVFYIEGGYYTGEAVGTSTAALSGYPYYEKYFGNGSTLSYKHLGFINVANGSFGNTNLIPSIALLSTGNVGIGTTNPSYRLDVQGTTTAHAISTQVGLNFNPVASPTTGSLALVASAGNVDLGIHYYFVTFTTALGETNPYQIGNITTTAGNQQVTVTIPVSTDPRVTGRKLYRTKATGQSYETFNLATIANNTATSYVDNIADASLTGTSGTGFYQVNTTHRAITLNGVQSLVIDTFATYLGVNAGGGVTSGGGNNTFIGYNAGRYSYTANQSVAIGNSALSAQTAGGNNIGIGSQAGGFTVGSDNIAIGRNAAVNINTGSSNTIVGSFTWNLGAVTGKSGNTGLGYRVGSNNTGNYNLFLGYDAGYYVTGSNQILLDTVTRADEATAKSSALIYGVTSATASSQILSLGGGGNVGIGTTTPVHNLVVNGNTGISINANGTTFPNIHRDSSDGGMLLRSWNGSVFSNSVKITPAGNVGIGTTTPTAKLAIIGSYTIGASIPTSWAAISAGRFGVVNGNNAFYFDNFGTYAELSTYNYGTTGTFPFVLQANGGNLLIGTTTDAGYKLDVNGNTRVAGSVEVGANSAVQGGLSLYQKYTTSTNFIGSISTEYSSGAMILGYGAVGKAGVAGYVSSFDNFSGYRSAIKIGQATPLLVLGTSSAVATTVGSDITMNTLFQITNAGNVGIGSSNPTQKLDVVGSTKLRAATFFGAISQPSAPTLTTNSTTGGTLAAATYYYRIVAVDAFGNTTTPSNELAVTTTGTTSSITISWPLVQGAYQYRIYRGTTSGGQNTYYTVSGTNAISFTDTGAAGTAGTTPAENLTSYGYYNTNGDFRSGNILIVNNGVGNTSSIIFDKSTDGPQINVTEYVNDGTLFEFSLRDNPDGPDAFHFVMPDWQNPSTGWKPFKFAAFTTQIVGQNTNFWSSFSMPSSTPYYTTNPESTANSQIKWDPYASTSYNVPKDSGTGTGVFNVDVTGFTLTTHKNYWVIIEAGATTFKWGLDWYAGTPSATGVAITGGWQTLSNGVQVKITGAVVANDRWSFRAFPVPKMGIGTTTPVAPLQVSTTIAATSGTARGIYFNPTVVATANNDNLVALDITPTFTVGAFTGVISSAIRFPNQTYITTANTTGSFYNVFGTDSNGTLRVGHIGLNTALFGANMSLTGNSVVRFVSNGGTNFVYVYTGTTGNVVLQNGGTFTDAGYRLDVNGTFRAQGSITATLANTVTSSMVYYNSSTGLLTYGAIPTPTTFQIDYDYNIVGVKNGVNVVFTTSANFVLTTTRVYLNGQRLTRGVGYDYVETGTNQVTFANPLNPTDQIIIEYQI